MSIPSGAFTVGKADRPGGCGLTKLARKPPGYPCLFTPGYYILHGFALFWIGVTQLDVFTLTLTLSLNGEGIAELRNSYLDTG